VSPNSITEWMKARSSVSITSSAWATSAMASSSDSVTRPVRPFVGGMPPADDEIGKADQDLRDRTHRRRSAPPRPRSAR